MYTALQFEKGCDKTTKDVGAMCWWDRHLSHLVAELSNCGLGNTALSCIQSYLSDRTQHVVCPQLSPGGPYPATRDFPQRSVLGPLIFSLKTRSLPGCVKSSTTQLYADNTGLYVADRNQETAVTRLEDDISLLYQYFKTKVLTLNATKCQFLHIWTPASPLRSSLASTRRRHPCQFPG